MIHLERLFADIILSTLYCIKDLYNRVTGKKIVSSLIADNIVWCTESGWMDRLVAYKQLELWTSDK